VLNISATFWFCIKTSPNLAKSPITNPIPVAFIAVPNPLNPLLKTPTPLVDFLAPSPTPSIEPEKPDVSFKFEFTSSILFPKLSTLLTADLLSIFISTVFSIFASVTLVLKFCNPL
jgi:hypothetical protein